MDEWRRGATRPRRISASFCWRPIDCGQLHGGIIGLVGQAAVGDGGASNRSSAATLVTFTCGAGSARRIPDGRLVTGVPEASWSCQPALPSLAFSTPTAATSPRHSRRAELMGLKVADVDFGLDMLLVRLAGQGSSRPEEPLARP
jgi:hypothetical protein